MICCKALFSGDVNSADVSIRKIAELAIVKNASAVILSHNHTSGIALPSREDEQTTKRIKTALEAMNIELLDHIIVAGDDYISMAENKLF